MVLKCACPLAWCISRPWRKDELGGFQISTVPQKTRNLRTIKHYLHVRVYVGFMCHATNQIHDVSLNGWASLRSLPRPFSADSAPETKTNSRFSSQWDLSFSIGKPVGIPQWQWPPPLSQSCLHSKSLWKILKCSNGSNLFAGKKIPALGSSGVVEPGYWERS